MDNFLETYKPPKLTQEEIKYLNRTITNKQNQLTIKKLLSKKNPGPDDFTAEIYPIFKEETTPIFLKLFLKLKERALPKSFYKARLF